MKNLFWAVNIPGDWTSLDDSALNATYRDASQVFLGKNSAGTRGLEKICPKKGEHRYRLSVWVLDGYVGTGDEPVEEGATLEEVLPVMQQKELAKAVVYARVKAEGGAPDGGAVEAMGGTGGEE